MNKEKRCLNKQALHSIIGVAIMVIFRFLPIRLPEVTQTGMEIIGIFIGTLYLWTTVDPLWSSLMCVSMIGFSSFGTMGLVMSKFFGDVTTVQMFFVMVLVAVMVYNKITLYIGNFFLSRKISNGRPWVFTLLIMCGAYIMSVFISPFVPIFLFWPVMYGVFDQVGYKKGEKYPAMSLFLIVLAVLAGFPVAPYMYNALAMLGNYRVISEGATVINDGKYFIVAFTMGIIILIALVLVAKYIFRPDVEKLKNYSVDKSENAKLAPMNLTQKIVCLAFIIFVLVMLVPNLINIPGMKFLKENAVGICIFELAVLGAITVKNKPIVEFSKVMEKNFAWSTFFLCATAILLGGVLTHESTGISSFLNVVLGPIFNNMGVIKFTIVLILLSILLTNICNSLVIGMLMQPIILNYCTNTGTNAASIISLLVFTVLSTAFITPAASPFAAMVFGNKEWIKTKDVYKYGFVFIIIEILILLGIGMPFFSAVM